MHLQLGLLLFFAAVAASAIEVEEDRNGRGLEWLNPLSWFGSRNNDRQLADDQQQPLQKRIINSAEEATYIVIDKTRPEGRRMQSIRSRRPNDKMASYFQDGEPQQMSPVDYDYEANQVESSRLDFRPYFEAVSPKHKVIASECVCRCDCCDCCPCSEDRMDLILIE